MMLQMRHENYDKFVRAKFPESQVQQVKFTAVQRTHPQATTAEGLLQAIPEAAIHASGCIVPTPGYEGVYTFSAAFDDLPLFDWARLFSEVILGELPRPPAKLQARRVELPPGALDRPRGDEAPGRIWPPPPPPLSDLPVPPPPPPYTPPYDPWYDP